MKLNNKGWGLSTMIILMVVIILILIIVWILMYQIGIGKDSPHQIIDNELIIIC